MKCFILVACALALTASGQQFQGNFQVPVIGQNGVPQDTPEVQAARRNHFAALAASSGFPDGQFFATAQGRGNNFNNNNNNQFFVAQQDGGSQFNGFNANQIAGFGNDGSLLFASQFNGNGFNQALTSNGVPLDTPEVQAARARHFNALAAASAAAANNNNFNNADGFVLGQGFGGNGGVFGNAFAAGQFEGVQLAASNAVPQDTPEVQAAKARHFEALRNAARGSFN